MLRLASMVSLFMCAVVTGVPARAQAQAVAAAAQSDVTARIVAAARALLGTLDQAERAKVQFPFDSPQRHGWSNLPTGIFKRAGLRLGDLTPAQRTAAMSLLSTAFSREGYRKIVDIMRGDEVLRKNDSGPGSGGAPPLGLPPGGPGNAPGGPGGTPGGPPSVAFGEDEYYLAFIGAPSAAAPWMIQFGGHHLAINFTMAGRDATLAPTLTGAQPARFTIEGRITRPLGNENDKAFALINALDEGQRKQATLPYTVSDLVLGPGQDGRTIQPEGVRASLLAPAEQTMLMDLVREWTGIMNDAFAEPRMAEIRAHLAETYFAWSGPTTNGSMAYFRVQGPTLVIEYAPQRSIDHIHTIYRDPTNDYGKRYGAH
jgi:hypothetical protein